MPSAARAYAAPVYNGEAGSRWENTTGKILFQLHCDLHNTCGTCLQFHLAIGPSWPIPFHRRCRCHQTIIHPGELGQPFVDFREVLAGLPHGQQVKAVGSSLYELISRGVVRWTDVVTPTRVRDLQEVVWKKKLTVKQMVKAGVKPTFAEQAVGRAFSDAAELLASKRAELLAKIRGAGMSDAQIREAVKEGLAKRFGIVGPSGTQVVGDRGGPGGLALFVAGGMIPPRIGGQVVEDVLGGKPAVPKPKPPRKPKVSKTPWLDAPTIEEGMDLLAEAQRLDDNINVTSFTNRAIEAMVDRHATDAGERAVHGMAKPEPFRKINVFGIEFNFSDLARTYDRPAIVEQVEQMHQDQDRWAAIPERLKAATGRVYLQSQANKNDAYWRARYRGFDGSLATGGDGTIVVYKGNAIMPGSFAHESGHNLAAKLYGSTEPGGDYRRAIVGNPQEPPVSDYAKNSRSEDFAEAAKAYALDPAKFRDAAPARFGVIDRIVKDPSYGG